MDQPEMRQIEQRLVAVLKKERPEAIGYTLLTVLCAPFFVVLIGLAVMIIQIRDNRLQLTFKGQDFVTAANQDEYAVE